MPPGRPPRRPGPDYLSGYSLELVPKGAGVDWGSKVEWENDPFEDLECDSMTVDVTDHLDVCSLFSEEVAKVQGMDWEFTVNWDTTNHRVEGWTLNPDGGATGMRFSTLWFDDDLDGKIKNANVNRTDVFGATAEEMHDLYDNNGTGATSNVNIETVWQRLTNTDGTPNRGDFGKVDLVSEEDDDDTTAVETTPDIRTASRTTTPARPAASGRPGSAATTTAKAATPSGPRPSRSRSPTAPSAAPTRSA